MVSVYQKHHVVLLLALQLRMCKAIHGRSISRRLGYTWMMRCAMTYPQQFDYCSKNIEPTPTGRISGEASAKKRVILHQGDTMKIIRVVFVTALLSTTAQADTTALPFKDNPGCNEGPLAQFGQYLGDWKIEDSRLSQETGEWEPGQGARWVFSCLGDGTAIQDFWLPPGGPVGTNLRTYNTETESWDIAWAIKGVPGFAHIGAKQNDAGEIVMEYKSPVPSPPRRITFYPVNDEGWNWKLEFSFDGGDSWTEVYRIKATSHAP